MEKQYECELKTAWEERLNKKIAKGAKQLDLAELKQTADEAMSAHDKSWNERGDVQHTIVVEKVATKTHFNSVKVKDNAFLNEIVNVLPFIGELLSPPATDADSTFAALKKQNKTAIMAKDGVLGKYIELVKMIAKGKADNIFSADLEGLNEDQILEVFVCAKNSTKLKELQDEVSDKWKKMEDIYHSAAYKIGDRYLKLMQKNPEEVAEEPDDEEG
jgi:hypothetical protein